MVLEAPFVWPSWNAAENSQRQTCKLSLTLSESTTRDALPGTGAELLDFVSY
jgi:hypothetical protein